jgi:hypothetical protein
MSTMFISSSTAAGAALGMHQASRTASFSGVGGGSWYYREFISSEKKIELKLQTAELDEGEARPSEQAIRGITKLVEVVSKTTPLASEAEVSVFYGEAVVTWKHSAREVSILSSGNPDNPKLLRYVGGQDQQPDPQVIANPTPDDLRQAIRWLYR